MIHRNVHARRRPRRAGFTLVELLVVTAIIGVLVGLVSAAVFRFLDTQKQKNTELVLQKTHDILLQRWSEAIKDIRGSPSASGPTALSSTPPQSVVAFAGNDLERAQVIWLKLQLRREFPMNYDEVRNPGGGVIPPPELPPVTEYAAAVGNRPSNKTAAESSACLVLALNRVRRGMKVSIEETLGPNALQDTDGDGLPEIVDGWGNPVFFFRWGTDYPGLDALSTSKSLLNRDTEDPKSTLMNTTWNGSNLRPQYELLCHRVTSIQNPNQPRSYFTIPAVVSAGKDGKFGLDLRMAPQGPDEADNVYSFKTR